MHSSAFLSELNIVADPWSPSNDSVVTLYSLLELRAPSNILCLGASNASIMAAMYSYCNDAKMHLVEEHEVILKHILIKGDSYMSEVTNEIVKTVEEKVFLQEKFNQPGLKDLDIAEEYRNKHDMLLSAPWEGERVTSRYSKIKKSNYDFIIVDGPRKSGLGRALPLMENIVQEECVIVWMNGQNDLVLEAIKYFDQEHYKNALTSFHMDSRDGIAITRLGEELL